MYEQGTQDAVRLITWIADNMELWRLICMGSLEQRDYANIIRRLKKQQAYIPMTILLTNCYHDCALWKEIDSVWGIVMKRLLNEVSLEEITDIFLAAIEKNPPRD